MTTNWDKIIREFLDKLERQEVQLLTWGIIDGGFSEDEIKELADDFLNNCEIDEDVWDFIEQIIDRKLLFEFNLRGDRLFRTRMAEGVRLFARLRQLFPNNSWQTSPTLVADYRLQIRPRIYPKRYITPEAVIKQLEADKLLTPIRKKAVAAILNSPLRGEVQLADFQLRATSRMLRDLNSTKSRGMIVCAGTGTGKTLSFYLPALAHIAGLLKKNEYWSKGLAIYPRNELLKDQFSETYQEARRLDAVLKAEGKRKILIGAFFGLTPRSATLDRVQDKWEAESGGFTCPYLRCPRCEGALSWRRADLEAGKEQLSCLKLSCGAVIQEDEVILTRDRMTKTPPDLVFTSTEMLNRSMGDSRYGHIFGIATAKKPQIVLLDEVHTYTGIHGAQVAYLLRRWQKIIATKVQFTGLSATLESAAEFFSQLIGLNPGSIEEVSPGENQVAEGTEYQLVLRGDPVSGTSLLSTTILTSMLLRRILDPSEDPPSQGFYGSRVFAFTDDLDVTNRLFHNLLDAEGCDSWGRPLRGRQPFAALRSHSASEGSERLVAGQSWLLCEEIGHGLELPLSIGRTSSQDTGVTPNSDVIVATASLEVGFNDPEVGGVIQHKSPRDMASFLQRKGRAGRRRIMRPWTVVVLSDYGRDRIVYQGYDMLFNPVLEKRSLPIQNRYVIRTSAVFAFMDWVGHQLAAIKGSVWYDFASPSEYAKKRQQLEIELIEKILETETRQLELAAYLQSALNLSKDEVEAILWEAPRSLMMVVLPTLLRRLKSNWYRFSVHLNESNQDYQTNDPLPDFVPPSLFSDLLLPEVKITTPPQLRNSQPDINLMPIIQALKTFTPGRASRRFGVQHIHATHWIAPPNWQEREQNLPIEDYCTEFEEAGIFQLWQNGEIVDIRCIRPWAINLTQVPASISVRSNAQLEWCSQIIPPDSGIKLELPQGSSWCKIITEVCCFTHIQQSPLEVRRFAIASHANIRFQKGDELDTTICFTQKHDGSPAAVGFAQSVDGLVFRFCIPPNFSISPSDSNPEKIWAFRTAYFRYRVLIDARLCELTNVFQREWLYQIYISMLTARALADQISLPEAFEALLGENMGQEMARVLDNIFQSLNVEETLLEEGESAPEQIQGRQRVHDRLLALANADIIQTILNDLAPILWSEPDEEWHSWAALRFKATLGGALLDACGQLCPHFDLGDLILDIDPGPRPPDASAISEGVEEIWITESTIGGGGVIEEILRRYAADPANFFRLAGSALSPGDFEIVNSELTRLLELTQTSADVADAMADVRLAEGHGELKQASDRLRKVLSSKGILVTHPVMTAINARVLRPGSTSETDKLLLDLIRLWHQEEARLGIEIDARVFAYVASNDDQLDQALLHLGLMQPNPYWRFQVIYGLLWARGNIIRSRALSSYNPFVVIADADREILLDILQVGDRTVWLNEPNWREQVEEAFKQGASVSLIAPPDARGDLKSAILSLAVEPMELGFLQVYPLVEGVQRYPGGFGVRLRVRETVQ
ncbi:protein DpdJ [Nostoc sp. FACHB-133]|uniref:protein DpdJ n=1 Tax=Nostoc sp. FACHB-133 TaxID=2692835 RepID=UPI001687CB23|nr:protein DpdJ [Nostoc sp. FACHB-133]MBD2525623.1 DEAD/DEAH box helicase [Nostoc sp. FACHB-133]